MRSALRAKSPLARATSAQANPALSATRMLPRREKPSVTAAFSAPSACCCRWAAAKMRRDSRLHGSSAAKPTARFISAMTGLMRSMMNTQPSSVMTDVIMPGMAVDSAWATLSESLVRRLIRSPWGWAST